MRSLSFPKIFNSNSSNVIKSSNYLASTKQNTIALLHCEKGELFGDPYFGIKLKRYLFDQNSIVLRDILIDEIYTQIALFIPQLVVAKKDISITQNKEKGKIYCHIKGINQISFKTDTYNLVLYDAETAQ